jgi:hypothetical protein
VPLLKKLKWREVMTFKSLWGGISQQNLPTAENGLVYFPTDANGTVLMNSLNKKPYIETSVGISNIFKIFRLDYVWRVNYRELQNAPKGGVRMRVKMEF